MSLPPATQAALVRLRARNARHQARYERQEAEHKRELRLRAETKAQALELKSDSRPLPVAPQHPVAAISLYAKPRSRHDARRKDVDAVLKHIRFG